MASGFWLQLSRGVAAAESSLTEADVLKVLNASIEPRRRRRGIPGALLLTAGVDVQLQLSRGVAAAESDGAAGVADSSAGSFN